VADLSSIEGTSNSISDSVGGTTSDIDNQQAAIAQQNQAARAQSLANEFQMSFESAQQLTELSDQVKTLTARGQMTDEDRAAVMDKTLAIAKLTAAEVNSATAAAIKSGDTSAMDALMVKAAQNLGMPSSQGLRDKLLPALGLQF
jgi:predicted phage tail protein